MKVVGLLSGGKDSCFNLMHCVAAGHEIVGLATLAPPHGQEGEMDSWMYQTAGHDAVPIVADAMGLPLFRGHIEGSARDTGAQYAGGDDSDETEDLARLLRQVQAAYPDLNGVSVGAIESNYQRVRVEHVCSRLGLVVLAYLWKRPQASLVNEMVEAGLQAVLIKVAGAGLGVRDLSKSLGALLPKLNSISQQFGAHVAGEGGEYETLTLDSPLHQKGRVALGETKVVMHTDTGGIADVAYLAAREAFLVPKTAQEAQEAWSSLYSRAFPRPPILDKMSERVSRHLPSSSDEPPPQYAMTRWEPWTQGAPKANLIRHTDRATITVTSASEGGMDLTARQAFEEVDATLGQHGLCIRSPPKPSFLPLSGEREELLVDHVNVYLSSQEHFALFNSEYGRHFGVAPPSRACIALPTPQPTTEVHGLRGLVLTLSGRITPASKSSNRSDVRFARSALHVQSRSYWAPANIGPYAQAVVSSAGIISIAGQIALVPSTMHVPPPAGVQALLALQHVRRILRAALVDLTAAPSSPTVGSCKHFVQGGIAWITDKTQLSASNTEHKSVLDEYPDNEYVSARALAQVAHVVWTRSSGSKSFGTVSSENVQEEEEEEEDDDRIDPEQVSADTWHESWMGQTASEDPWLLGPPVLYPVLPACALPRQARIEWQVLAHTGVPHPQLVEQVHTAAKADGLRGESDDEDDTSALVQVQQSVSHQKDWVRYDVRGHFGPYTVSRFRLDLVHKGAAVTSVLQHLHSQQESTTWSEVRVLLPSHVGIDTISSAIQPQMVVLPVLNLFALDPISRQMNSWDAAIVSTL